MQQLLAMSWSTNVLASQEKGKQTGHDTAATADWSFCSFRVFYGLKFPAKQELRVAHAQQRVFLSA